MPRLMHVIDHIRPGGGPYGYLYNLHSMTLNSVKSEFCVKYGSHQAGRTSGVSDKWRLPNCFYRNLKPFVFAKELIGFKKFDGEVPFVGAEDLCLCAHIAPLAARLIRIRGKSTKLCFMPHGPLTYSDEVMNDLELRFGRGILSKVYRLVLNKLEKRIFESVDAVVVASKFGIEGYFPGSAFPAKKIFEVVSGVPDFPEKFSKSHARSMLGLSDKRKVFGYFGRFNKDKGFDIFLDAIKNVSHLKDVHFICAGTGPLSPLTINSLTNFGWRSDVHVLISACDAIILPNRQTYFDLLPLESLSLGTPVIASNTGGNKKLAELSGAVITFDNDLKHGLSQAIEGFSLQPDDVCCKQREVARRSYEEHFSELAFVRNHERLSSEVLSFFELK